MRSACLQISLLVIGVSVVATNSAAAVDDDVIPKAIKKGQGYLKSIHQPGANYRGGSHGTGTAPLVGLALLESGVPADDPVMKNIIAYVREHALWQTATYNLSLTILFLDRLGDPLDRPTIQLLGVRLLAGQLPSGGWSYECGNALTNADEARLKKLFQNESKLANKPVKRNDLPVDPNAPPKPNPEPKAEPMPKKDEERPKLHPEVAKWARLVNQNNGRGKLMGGDDGDGDNSNTQFAVLGVWAARKHGVPCDGTVGLFERRFRFSQQADGSWGYTSKMSPPKSCSQAMTCAGLLALAVAYGNQNILKNKPDNKEPAKPNGIAFGDDPAVNAALKYIGNGITAAKGQPPEGRIEPKGKRNKRFKPDDLNSNLYFLWSLERVAVLYGLETIGNHDWYFWGADALIEMQLANGSWAARAYHGANPEINTAFALLFLSRANIARDLSAVLQGKVRDPGVAVLRSGNPKISPKDERPKPEPKPVVDVPKPEPKAIVDTPKPEPKVNQPAASDVVTLTRKLVNASDAERAGLLAKYRDEKGSAYTDALATAACKWTGVAQREAREALANRLKRMTVATLRTLLKDEDSELRRAAALACGAKEAKDSIPDLIEALRDAEEVVVRAAHTSLRTLTAQDFGPNPDAAAGEKLKSVLAWRNWWKSQMR
jgi:HEAT repeats